jgi:hypothetical protein
MADLNENKTSIGGDSVLGGDSKLSKSSGFDWDNAMKQSEAVETPDFTEGANGLNLNPKSPIKMAEDLVRTTTKDTDAAYGYSKTREFIHDSGVTELFKRHDYNTARDDVDKFMRHSEIETGADKNIFKRDNDIKLGDTVNGFRDVEKLTGHTASDFDNNFYALKKHLEKNKINTSNLTPEKIEKYLKQGFIPASGKNGKILLSRDKKLAEILKEFRLYKLGEQSRRIMRDGKGGVLKAGKSIGKNALTQGIKDTDAMQGVNSVRSGVNTAKTGAKLVKKSALAVPKGLDAAAKTGLAVVDYTGRAALFMAKNSAVAGKVRTVSGRISGARSGYSDFSSKVRNFPSDAKNRVKEEIKASVKKRAEALGNNLADRVASKAIDGATGAVKSQKFLHGLMERFKGTKTKFGALLARGKLFRSKANAVFHPIRTFQRFLKRRLAMAAKKAAKAALKLVAQGIKALLSLPPVQIGVAVVGGGGILILVISGLVAGLGGSDGGWRGGLKATQTWFKKTGLVASRNFQNFLGDSIVDYIDTTKGDEFGLSDYDYTVSPLQNTVIHVCEIYNSYLTNLMEYDNDAAAAYWAIPKGWYLVDSTAKGRDKDLYGDGVTYTKSYYNKFWDPELNRYGVESGDIVGYNLARYWGPANYRYESTVNMFDKWYDTTYKDVWVPTTYKTVYVGPTYKRKKNSQGKWEYVYELQLDEEGIPMTDMGRPIYKLDAYGQKIRVVDVPAHYEEVVDVEGHYEKVVDVPEHWTYKPYTTWFEAVGGLDGWVNLEHESDKSWWQGLFENNVLNIGDWYSYNKLDFEVWKNSPAHNVLARKTNDKINVTIKYSGLNSSSSTKDAHSQAYYLDENGYYHPYDFEQIQKAIICMTVAITDNGQESVEAYERYAKHLLDELINNSGISLKTSYAVPARNTVKWRVHDEQRKHPDEGLWNDVTNFVTGNDTSVADRETSDASQTPVINIKIFMNRCGILDLMQLDEESLSEYWLHHVSGLESWKDTDRIWDGWFDDNGNLTDRGEYALDLYNLSDEDFNAYFNNLVFFEDPQIFASRE